MSQDARGVHMFSPRVEKSIQAYFTTQQPVDKDRRHAAELLAEEQERAIEYLRSAPRRRIQELGRTRQTPLILSQNRVTNSTRAQQNISLKKNLIHPQSLPRLKEETSHGELSLKQII